MAAPPGFADLLGRKYDILQNTATSEAGLRAAQAQGITGSLDSENALRNAQAFSTTEQGKTFGPLSQASIAHTYQGEIPLEQSQAGLYNTEGQVQQFNTLRPASIAERTNYFGSQGQGAFGLLSPGGGGGAAYTGMGDTPGYGAGNYSPGSNKLQLIGSAGGATDVQKPGMSQPTMGAPAPQPHVAPTAQGGMDIHSIIAHALGVLHAAGGATIIAPQPQPAPAPPPGPGQTQTSGDWGTGGQNQNLRKQMGYGGGVKAAGGATTVQPQPTPTVPAPGQTVTNGTWGAPTPNQDLRKQMGYGGVKAAGGATDIDQSMAAGPPMPYPQYDSGAESFAKGTSKVPGKGPSNKDSVPAVLAPGEAVLNSGAAQHMGRGAIAALNALGAHAMAQAGAAPETPPTANGVPMAAPPRGMPAPKGPPGRGMPPKGALPPAKAAAKPAAKEGDNKKPLPFAKKAG